MAAGQEDQPGTANGTEQVPRGSSKTDGLTPRPTSRWQRFAGQGAKLRDAISRATRIRPQYQDWLHGTMEVTIFEAQHLPGDPTIIPCTPFFINSAVAKIPQCCGKEELAPMPYLTIRVGGVRAAYASSLKRTLHPKWNEKFTFAVAGPVEDVIFQIKDTDAFGSPHLGRATISGRRLISEREVDEWLQLYHTGTGRPVGLGKGKLHVRVKYTPEEEEAQQERGTWEVPHTYFPPRTACRVTLYGDAHQEADKCPEFKLADGLTYKEIGAWDDIYTAICNAKHLIYITGWAVWTPVRLVRDQNLPEGEGKTSEHLGNLLKRKAEEGVRVLLLLWDDRTSVQTIGFKTQGQLGTHDEDTKDFFADSKVVIKLALRQQVKYKNILQKEVDETIFTHHQKSVIVDAPDIPDGMNSSGMHKAATASDNDAGADSNAADVSDTPGSDSADMSDLPSSGDEARRRLVAFVGGLDLTDGRYDTRDHSLFQTMNTYHSEEFYNLSIAGADEEAGGPREPWHDVHACLEGQIAWDVYTNFEQRWRKQAEDKIDFLMKLDEVPGLANPRPTVNAAGDAPSVEAASTQDPVAWTCQLFRSIDNASVVDIPTDNAAAFERGLGTRRGQVVDASVQAAYIHAIRRAQRFIYIENQYFIGGSNMWGGRFKENIADNLVPVELTMKILQKIASGERFAAYILLPMWPEGVPETGAVQEVLHWTTKTIRMMYANIGAALDKQGMQDAHPRDYLNFFCLGNREPVTEHELKPTKEPKANSPQAILQKSRRFMIYVHAKTMIVDDEYIIMGSANINQRSLDGSRDTEIAFGAHQPHLGNRGHVFGFRMALWEEHTNLLDKELEQPESLECVQKITTVAKENWDAYIAENVQSLPHGHLLPYPHAVNEKGWVTPLPNFANFPDTKAEVKGKKALAYLNLIRKPGRFGLTT